MRRLGFALAILVALILGVGGMAQQRVTIAYWSGFTGPDRPLMEALVQQFNDTHPNIVVEPQFIPWGELFAQLGPAVAAGQAPEVAVINEDQITGFIARGVVQELTPETLQAVGIDRNRFYASLFSTADYQGRSYGVPIHSVALVMYYNRDLFEQAGLDPDRPPTNRDEFLAATQRLTVDRNGRHPGEAGFDVANVVQWGTGIPIPWMGGTIFYSVLLQNGGSLLSADLSEAAFNSPAGVEALQFLVDLINRHQVSPGNVTEDDTITAFRQGTHATNFNGVWRLNDYRNQEGLNFGIAPFPRLGTVQDAAWGGSSHLVLPVQRRPDLAKQAAALEFIAWITQPEQNLFWTGAGGLPTQPAVAENSAFEANIIRNIFAALPNVYATSGAPWIGQTRGALDTGVADALLGVKDPQAALDDAVAEANQQIQQAMEELE